MKQHLYIVRSTFALITASHKDPTIELNTFVEVLFHLFLGFSFAKFGCLGTFSLLNLYRPVHEGH